VSTTGRDLARRRRLLVLLTVLATLALFGSYAGVTAGAVPLASSTAAGILDVDTAVSALQQADESTQPAHGDTAVGAGDFHTQIAVADQSLALAAAEDVTGASGRQTLQTLEGLIAPYSSWVEQAGRTGADSTEHAAMTRYAEDVLGRDDGTADDSTIMGRLAALHEQQVAVAREQAAFGGPLWLGWTLAAVFLVAQAAALVEAHRYLRGRFRRRWNRQLAAALLLVVAGTAAAAVLTWQTHHGLVGARAVLAAPHSGQGISAAGTEVAHRMAGTGFRAAAGYGILAGGAAVVGLVVWAFQPRIAEYRSGEAPAPSGAPAGRVRRAAGPGRLRLRPRAAVAGVACLAVLAAVGVVVVRQVVWRGSVTVLANWTGSGAEAFRREVIEPFEAKEHIHVLYQGSSAESQVLAADVESGTPPDIAVLPGPGELAEYAAQGRLEPLNGLFPAGEFDAPWEAPALGPDQRTRLYWVPVKSDLKSLVWHPRDLSAGQVAQAAARPDAWCLGMVSGATSGWPGTDWVEDVLLQQQGARTYEQWAIGRLPWTDPAVVKAFRTVGQLLGAGGKAAARGLTTDYSQEAQDVGRPGGCDLEHQSTFVRGEDAWRQAGPVFAHSRDVVPGADPREPHDWEVSGDLAAMLGGGAQARELISYLARTDVQKRWSQAQGGFSADSRITSADYSDGTDRGIVSTLRDPRTTRCYDASDAMPPTVRDAFELAVIHYLADPAGLMDGLNALEKLRTPDLAWQTKVCGSG
jgi:alpha-glucoside transport system substrate-binding protein